MDGAYLPNVVSQGNGSVGKLLTTHYDAVRKRLKNPPPKPVSAPIQNNPQPALPVHFSYSFSPNQQKYLLKYLVSHPKAFAPLHRNNCTIGRIIMLVAQHFSITKRDMLSARKMYEISRPRMIVMYLARHFTNRSLPDIGQRLNKDHTTCLHAVRRIAELRLKDSVMCQDIAELEQELGGLPR